MSLPEKVREKGHRPDWWIKNTKSQLRKHVIRRPLQTILYSRVGSPINHFKEDWDNLIILDACRFKYFKEQFSRSEQVDYRISPGSHTAQWLRRTVKGELFHDTVYVSANPRVKRYADNFHRVENVWLDGWDDTVNVAPPEPVVDEAIEAFEKFPNKRIVAHFMQPHQPFIGEFARENLHIGDGELKGRLEALGKDHEKSEIETIRDEYRTGNIDRDDFIRGYRENLDVVLGHVDELLDSFGGLTVISADHGEMFDERSWPVWKRLFGHPGAPALALRKVPWVEIQDGERRRITEDPPDQRQSINEDVVKDRLHQLGYVDEKLSTEA